MFAVNWTLFSSSHVLLIDNPQYVYCYGILDPQSHSSESTFTGGGHVGLHLKLVLFRSIIFFFPQNISISYLFIQYCTEYMYSTRSSRFPSPTIRCHSQVLKRKTCAASNLIFTSNWLKISASWSVTSVNRSCLRGVFRLRFHPDRRADSRCHCGVVPLCETSTHVAVRHLREGKHEN